MLPTSLIETFPLKNLKVLPSEGIACSTACCCSSGTISPKQHDDRNKKKSAFCQHICIMFILLKGPQSGLASGEKEKFCSSVVGELVEPGGAISPTMRMLKRAT